jgi:hypothetical protein
LRPTEGGTVSAQPDKRYRSRPVTSNLGSKKPSAPRELAGGQLVGGGRSPVHQVGEPVAELEQLAILRWMEEARREARGMERRPEAVAGPGEVTAGGGRVQAGIDAAEEDFQPRGKDVAQALAVRGRKIRGARTA